MQTCTDVSWRCGLGERPAARQGVLHLVKTEVHGYGQCKLHLGGTSKKTVEISEGHSNENKQMLFSQSVL